MQAQTIDLDDLRKHLEARHGDLLFNQALRASSVDSLMLAYRAGIKRGQVLCNLSPPLSRKQRGHHA